jgi:SAM-dependent methyltransferase
MKPLDRLLQRWRIARARSAIPHGARVLDIGCGDGALFRLLAGHVGGGMGIDPLLTAPVSLGAAQLLPGSFPRDLPDCAPFEVITLLAVLEHVPRDEQPTFLGACAARLAPGGLLVITVPSPRVDLLLRWLRRLRLVEGMALEQHYGFDPRTTPALCAGQGFRLLDHRRFQLGLNHLFVFQKGSPLPFR